MPITGRIPPAAVTEIPGNFMTSALWNAQITNGLESFVYNPPYFKGNATAAQSLSTSTNFQLITLSGAVTDTEGGWSAGSPTIYTVQAPGRYMMIATVCLPTNGTTDTSARGVGIWLAGSVARVTESANAPNVGWEGQCILTQFLAANTTVSMYAMQNSGITLSTVVAGVQQQPTLELIWMGSH